MRIPEKFHVFETDNWFVNHRINSALPGYLMVSPKIFTNELSKLSDTALAELGPLLAKLQNVLEHLLGAQRVYIGRYGHTEGHMIHFHVIPICAWVEALFWHDDRYRLLESFAQGPGETATDGAELTLFVWREFCERTIPPPVDGPTVEQTINVLREGMRVA
ncbi:HIT family protein [Phyllobacterium sp. YR531]|uniref:HIT family protein n=1 Tax=Phyllobacterium sp. YR531 TaxID=1144343 RepID=UPI000593F5BA|nr:HIT family protein [Phyllobacterium sp. YR531]